MAAPRAELLGFVRDALSAGRGRAEIREALHAAGWPEREVARALGAFAEGPFAPPVPRYRPYATPRDVAIFGLGAFALGVVLVNGVAELFALVERALGQEAGGIDRREAWRIAAVLVFGPVFAAIDLRADRDNPVRKALAYAAFFFAALVLLFTATGVIALALSGVLGAEVLWKALIVAVTAGGVLLYYRKDLGSDSGRHRVEEP